MGMGLRLAAFRAAGAPLLTKELYLLSSHQDAIHRIKVAFNKEFDEVFKQKEAEIKRVKEKNDRIRKILGDLEIDENVFEPEMSVDEKPELLLEVKNDEVPFEKYISPEEKLRLEELAKIEEGL